MQRDFGALVRLVSTKLEKTADGGVRTTTIDFDDVTSLRLRFPPVFMSMSQGFGMDGIGDQPVIRFNITNNPGYDNQPFFTPDGRSVLFTSVRPSTGLGTGGPAGTPQTDIYRYDLQPRTISQVTNTAESGR